MKLKLGWSNFAIKGHITGTSSNKFLGNPDRLLKLVEKHWEKREPGEGRKDLTQVVVVPILEPQLHKLFKSSLGHITEAKHIRGKLTCRQPNEDPYIDIQAKGTPLPVRYAKVVLYAKATLLENDGEISGDFDWEIVAIICSYQEKIPMNPLTMARNFLKKPGGTFAPYTAQQFAEAIYFWSLHTKLNDK